MDIGKPWWRDEPRDKSVSHLCSCDLHCYSYICGDSRVWSRSTCSCTSANIQVVEYALHYPRNISNLLDLLLVGHILNCALVGVCARDSAARVPGSAARAAVPGLRAAVPHLEFNFCYKFVLNMPIHPL